jgi:hypothetical protein
MKFSWKPFYTGITVGALLVVIPLLGMAFGMFRSFGALQDSGISDPNALSTGVSFVLYSPVVGAVLCPVGIVILVASLVLRARARRTEPPPLPPLRTP